MTFVTQEEMQNFKKKEFALKVAVWRKRPDLWLKERFGEDPKAIVWTDFPGYDSHTWDGSINPLFKAWYELGNQKWVGVESATGTGKTYILARIVYWFLDVYENSQVFTTAPKESQLTINLWKEMGKCFRKFKKIRPKAVMNKLRIKVDGTNVNNLEDEEDFAAVGWGAFGIIAGVKANEESTTKVQGLHGEDMLIICEETPGIPTPTMTAFVSTSTGGNNLILAVGNPNSITDTLHSFIRLHPSKVVHVIISALDHPNIVLQKELFPGAVTQGSVDLRKDRYGEDNWFYKSRVRGIAPSQGPDALFRYEWILKCTPWHPTYEEADPDNSKNALGIDVANSEDGDAACLAWGIKNRLANLHEFQCPNANHLAYNVCKDNLELLRKSYHNYNTMKIQGFGHKNFGSNETKSYVVNSKYIGVDSVGVGAGTVNVFKDMKMDVCTIQGGQNQDAIPKDKQDKPLYEFANMRSQVYFMAALDLQEGKLILDLDKTTLTELSKELIVIEFHMKNGKIFVESKDSVKQKIGGKSPNKADSFVYWNYVRKGFHITSIGFMPIA